jgi:putative ATP-binding cassette transporter
MTTWDQQLSPDEQQRLTFVRALLHEPQWIIMDDATAQLYDPGEQAVYALLARQLPRSTVLCITTRAVPPQFHARTWDLLPTATAARTA